MTRCLLAALVLGAPTWGHAQGWIVDLSGGHSAHDAIATPMEVNGLMLGVRHEGAWWLSASAGVPLDSAGLPWGALGLGWQLSTGGQRLAVGLDIGAQGFGYRDPGNQRSGGGVTGEAMPGIRVVGGPMRIEARSGVLHYTRVFSGALTGRTLHQTDARAVLETGTVAVAGETRYLRAPEGAYPYVGGGVEVGVERLLLSAHGGTWMSKSIPTPVWGIAARLRVSRGADAHLSLRQETNDPLYWEMPRRSWSGGFSYRLGAQPPRTAAPLPAPGAAGTTFRLPRSASPSAPVIAGDFSGWKEVQMVRSGGFWSITLPVASGIHRYAFRGADGVWFVPEGYPGREADGYGGFNAVLIIP